MRTCLAFVATVALVAVAASAASAATDYERMGAFAVTANDGGLTVSHHGRIAVNATTGDVYVTNTVDDCIDVYRPTTTGADLLTSFGAGGLTNPYGIAIDQSSGDVYVSDSGSTRVRKFISDNAPTPTLTLDGTFASPGDASALSFDQAANELVYIDPISATVKRATTGGAATGTPLNGATSGAAFTNLQDLAVTSTGEIIVVDSTGDPAQGIGESRVERFASSGSSNGALGPVAGAATVGVVGDGDRILVSGMQDAINTNAFATLTLFASDGTTVASLRSSERFSIVTGLAAASGADPRVYVASDTPSLYGGAYGNASVQAFEPFTLPTVGVPAVSDVTATSAHLSATVNPEGGPTAYRFEVSVDGTSWTAIDPDGDGDEDAGSGTAAITVSVDATALTPNADYQARVVLSKRGATVTSDEAPLTTNLGAPAAETMAASALRATSVSLRGKVTTYGAAATYHFEYGTTTSYGTTVPVADIAIAAGIGVKTVAQPVSGLDPQTTYHYRLVATNAIGTTQGDDRTFTTDAPAATDTCPNAAIRAKQHSTYLPDCRAYELVSPAEKNGYPVFYSDQLTAGMTKFSVDGDAALFTSYGLFAGAASGMPQTYRSARSASGWTTTSVTPPTVSVVPNPNTSSEWNNYWLLSTPDLRAGLLKTRDLLWAGDRDDTAEIYHSDIDGRPTLVSRGNGSERATTVTDRVFPDGISDDGTRSFFTSYAHFVPADAPRGLRSDLYMRAGDRTTLLQEKPDGSLLNECGSMLGSGSTITVRNAISHDGGQVIFSVPGADTGGDPLADCDVPRQLWMRRSDGALTQISASRRSTPETALPAVYDGAATDGSRIYFTSKERLIDSAPVDGGLYVYEPGTDTLRLAVATTDIQVHKVSDDGRTVAFQSGDPAFAPQVPGSDPGFVNVYSYREGASGATTIRFVTRNPLGDIGHAMENGRPVDISPDGRTLAFISRGRLTGFDNTQATTGDPASEVFVWTADDGLRCVSCDVAGQRPAGAQIVGDARVPVGVNLDSPPGRSVTENGRVFFQTPDRLVAADTNSTQDVYEYADGRVSLISSGTADIQVNMIGAATSGDSVLFVTPDSLVAGDVDGGNLDLYVARVNGGIPAQNDEVRSRPGCEGDACQAPPAARSPAPAPGSAAIIGAGDDPAPRAPKAVAKVKVTAPKTAKGTSFTVQVKAPAKGTIRVAGASVVTRTVKVGKAGTSRVTVRLSAKARGTLAAKRKLTVRISARFTPSAGKAQTASATTTITPAVRSRSSRSATASTSNTQNGEKS